MLGQYVRYVFFSFTNDMKALLADSKYNAFTLLNILYY